MKSIIWPFIIVLVTACTTTPTTPTLGPGKGERVALPWKQSAWDTALYSAIDEQFSDLTKAKDLLSFCPNFNSLDEAGKKTALAFMFVAIAKPESSWDPTTRYFEKTMGYYSEGLYQLSTVDESWAKCGLSKDTILKPDVNIRCAVKIMAGQIRKQGVVKATKGFYWAVIIPGGRYQKIAQIETESRKAPGCLK